MDKNPQYFEGVLQLRNPTQQIIDFVASAVERKENVWIAKSKNLKNGIDLYLSSNRFLREIGKKLKEKFSGQLTHSNTLFTRNRQTSKEVYRGCVLFRYFNIKKGDILTIRGEEIKVLAYGKDILGKSLDSNKKVHIKFTELR